MLFEFSLYTDTHIHTHNTADDLILGRQQVKQEAEPFSLVLLVLVSVTRRPAWNHTTLLQLSLTASLDPLKK